MGLTNFEALVVVWRPASSALENTSNSEGCLNLNSWKKINRKRADSVNQLQYLLAGACSKFDNNQLLESSMSSSISVIKSVATKHSSHHSQHMHSCCN